MRLFRNVDRSHAQRWTSSAWKVSFYVSPYRWGRVAYLEEVLRPYNIVIESLQDSQEFVDLSMVQGHRSNLVIRLVFFINLASMYFKNSSRRILAYRSRMFSFNPPLPKRIKQCARPSTLWITITHLWTSKGYIREHHLCRPNLFDALIVNTDWIGLRHDVSAPGWVFLTRRISSNILAIAQAPFAL